MNTQHLSENAQLAMDTIHQKPTKGIPSWMLLIMEHQHIERLAGVKAGQYEGNPIEVYCAMQRNIGTCMLDQYIPTNPMRFSNEGIVDGGTLSTEIVLNGMQITSPEDVVEHMERFVFPGLKQQIADFDAENLRLGIVDRETQIKSELGPDILKCDGGMFDVRFPLLRYEVYGYEYYLMAYALYPEIMEKHFSLQADLYTLNNIALGPLFEEGFFPPYNRVGQDLAGSSGMLVDIKSLDKLWFPHFIRCMEPIIKTGTKLVWHCDGNLNDLLPRLLDIGFSGFQGFQYEDGMDYETICKWKTRDGNDLIIIGGVSVTETLPFGTPDDVRKELKWLVDNGPKTGLFLGCNSSIAPGVPWENIKALVEGLKYYREHGRD